MKQNNSRATTLLWSCQVLSAEAPHNSGGCQSSETQWDYLQKKGMTFCHQITSQDIHQWNSPILHPNRLVAGLVTGWVHDPSACDPAAVLGTVWTWLLLSNDKHCTSFLIVSASSDLSLKPAVWALGLPCLFEKTNCNIFFSHTAKDEVDWIQDIRIYLAELEVTSYLTHSICSHG